MKIKSVLGVFLAALFIPCCAFAQVAKVIDLNGQVTIKKNTTGGWEKARLNMVLNKDAEVQTQDNSYCTLAFDEEQKNIVTLKQNSHIKIDSIKPGAVFLPTGRVFSLIKDLAKNEKFQVRTPTAIAGARGTGWVTDYDGSCTRERCFDDTISVQGIDSSGNPAGEADLSHGIGMDICAGGRLGPRYDLNDDDQKEWSDFAGYVGDLPGGGNGGSGDDGLSDARDEQRDDLRGKSAEERHQGESDGPTNYKYD